MNKELSPLVNSSLAAKTTNKNSSEPPPNVEEVPVKFCKDCDNYTFVEGKYIPSHYCDSPFNSFRDIVTGEIRRKSDDIYQIRSSDLFCGQKANWFIPKKSGSLCFSGQKVIYRHNK